MNNAAMNLAEPVPLLGDWHRDPEGRVVAVICECGNPLYYQRKVHARLVDPDNGTALCKRCKEWGRVPVRFSNQWSLGGASLGCRSMKNCDSYF